MLGGGSQKSSASLCCQPLLLRASEPEFKHLLEEGPTEMVYSNSILGKMSTQEQGNLLQDWARQTLRKIHPERVFLDPEPGVRCDGGRRSAYQAEYDFAMDEVRVEVKSSRLTWDLSKQVWLAAFWHIKLSCGKRGDALFDDLYLVLASPSDLLLIKHDLCTGISSDGKRTETTGHKLTVYGGAGDSCREALDTILHKLCEENNCTVVARQSLCDAHLDVILAAHRDCHQEVYCGIPLSNLSSAKRGLRIEGMALAIDRQLHPESEFLHDAGLADWARDGVRVEMKSCKLVYCKTKLHWYCRFRSIKPQCFEELWLAIYSPQDVRFYKCSSTNDLGLITNGVRTEHFGLDVSVSVSRYEEDLLEALRVIETKLMSRGCMPVAVVEWETSQGFQHIRMFWLKTCQYHCRV